MANELRGGGGGEGWMNVASPAPALVSSQLHMPHHHQPAAPLLNVHPLLNDENSETYVQALNLFSTESNKHTYAFEKQYYTRSIEFSDYLRTDFNLTAPVVNYFLNETTWKEARRDTVSATIPIWLDKVPTAVTGVFYDARRLSDLLFENYMQANCQTQACRNLCSSRRAMNLTCYLVDEHGIVVLATEKPAAPGERHHKSSQGI